MQDFEDKVVVVTGGANGTGSAIVESFANQGATVVVADIDGEGCERRAGGLTLAPGAQAVPHQVDVGDSDACATLIDSTYDRFGTVDVLVNCAGIFAKVPAIEMEIDQWKRMFDVCIHGAYYTSRALARRLIADDRPGAIVNISSTASTHSAPGVAAYSAAKAAISSLTRSLGVEWAPNGIRVNAVAPSHIDVPRLRAAADAGYIDLEAVARSIPMGRMAEPSEVADAVLFLAGPRAGFVTSQVLFVDGGFSVPPIFR